MANSPIEVIIVGDISVETAIAETAKTLGALPKRPELVEPPGIRDVKFPPAGNVVLKHKGRADQGYALVAWPTGQGTYADLKASRIGGILGQMIRDNATRASFIGIVAIGIVPSPLLDAAKDAASVFSG